MKRPRIVGVGILLLVLILFYICFVNFTDRQHVGIALNRANGNLQLQNTGGWHFTALWVSVTRVDIRPTRVCITSASRGYNCKLVQFVPEAYQQFVETEGFRYYWWANRLSFNSGYSEEYRGMKDIIRGYAFSAHKYPFIRIIDDYVGGP